MILNTLRSELTKLFSTRSVWWTTGVFFFISIGWTLMITTITNSQPVDAQMPVTAPALLSVLYTLAMPVLLIQGIMVVTTEYRFNIQTNVYMSNHNRLMVAAVKAVMYGVIAAVLVVVGILASVVVAKLVLGGEMGENFEIFDDFTTRALWVFPLGMFMLIVFGQGLGLIMRQTTGAVAISLILYLGIDSMVGTIPKIGEDIVNFMPFTALNTWIMDGSVDTAPWDSTVGSAIVFAVWAAVSWVVGVFMLVKRDA
ncbi:ABC transporter permease [Corynebacterium sp. L4756]|uniref:ABC transporter permease n=1 Tax=unclassified Corynebacterium TaxID=2624378 RepID=UPI00374D62F6